MKTRIVALVMRQTGWVCVAAGYVPAVMVLLARTTARFVHDAPLDDGFGSPEPDRARLQRPLNSDLCNDRQNRRDQRPGINERLLRTMTDGPLAAIDQCRGQAQRHRGVLEEARQRPAPISLIKEFGYLS